MRSLGEKDLVMLDFGAWLSSPLGRTWIPAVFGALQVRKRYGDGSISVDGFTHMEARLLKVDLFGLGRGF